MAFNVLSLFDGMSCGQIALERAGIQYDNYFASEIDKYAIKVTQANYPNTIQIGDVCKVKGSDLPKIDLLIGGSPCQGFSFSGKQLNFEDPRSALFFEFVRLLKECKPRYFLLENVRMKSKYLNIISSYLDVNPIIINSALVSAQNRVRYYWTNIPNVSQPKDKGILLKDVLEDGFVDKGKSYCIDANYGKGGNPKRYFLRSSRQLVFSKEGLCHIGDAESSNSGGSAGAGSALVTEDVAIWRKLTPLECERLQTVPDGYTRHVSDSQRYKMIGNGWTVDVITHIFKGLGTKPSPKVDKPQSLIPWHEIQTDIE